MELANAAFSRSDSVFLVLLVAVGIGFWRVITYVMKKNDEREGRYIAREDKYIDVINTQALGLRSIETIQKDVQEIKHYIYTKEEAHHEKRD